MLDWICNHIGNERWMEKLQWTGQKGYNDAKWEDWKVKGKAAGYTKASGNLSVSSYVIMRYCADRIDGQDLWCWYVCSGRLVVKLTNRPYGSL